MRSMFLGLFLIALSSFSAAELVGTPVYTNTTPIVYTAVLTVSVGAESYTVKWERDSSLQASDSVLAGDFPADGIFSRAIVVSEGSVVCVSISASNAGGTTPADRVCANPAVTGIPDLPEQPTVLSIVAP